MKATKKIRGHQHSLLLTDLKYCTKRKDLQWGRRIHAKAAETPNGLSPNVVIALIRMYAKCRSIDEACTTFEALENPDVLCWNTLLLGYAESGEGVKAMELFSKMKAYGCPPDPVTYVAALKACTSLSGNDCLDLGRKIHSEVGCHLNNYVENTLINMYAHCGCIGDAQHVFDNIQHPSVVSWNALIHGYAENGKGHIALGLFLRMKEDGCTPDSITYTAALKACTSLAVDGHDKLTCLHWGREIHSQIDCQQEHCVQGPLIDMYVKCGSVSEAREVFDHLRKPNVVSWNALLLGYVYNREAYTTLELFSRMKEVGCIPDSVTYVAALKACASLAVNGVAKKKCLGRGRVIHSEIGSCMNNQVKNSLVDMYAKCGSILEARVIFDGIDKPSVVSWTALLLGYVDHGKGLEALDLFAQMKVRGCSPDSVVYIAALKACMSLAITENAKGKAEALDRGRNIDAEIGAYLDTNVKNTLIGMYAKCGSMVEARRVFDSIQDAQVVSWTALILGYAENGEGQVALDLFGKMKAGGCLPDSRAYLAAVKACTSLALAGKKRFLDDARDIHCDIGDHLNLYVENTLIDMYAKFGSMVEAQRVFDNIQRPNVVSWNALLLGYAENGKGHISLGLYSRMKASGCYPDSVTYIAALKSCACMAISGNSSEKRDWLELGKQVHSEIGSSVDSNVQASLIDMYAKCGSMENARRVFDSIQSPSVASWNSLLLGYVENGKADIALELFWKMKACSSFTYVAALKACKSLSGTGNALERGKKVHAEIGCQLDRYVQGTLIDMYIKCGSIVDARRVFESLEKPDAVSWTTLLLGYVEHGDAHTALDLFSRMEAQGCALDSVAYVAALKACAALAVNGDQQRNCLERGREIQSKIGSHLNHFVQNTLIDLYAKCRSMVDAHQIFDDIEEPDVVSWTNLILGYAESGEGHVALDLFSRMQRCKCLPDSITYVGALKACGLVGALALGRTIHSQITDFSAPVVTCLINCYARCGSMVEACDVFDSHSGSRDVSTWNAVLAGYASFGDTKSVFESFKSMQDLGFHPDSGSFLFMFLCCSHAGLVEKSKEYLDVMPTRYGVMPTVLHYTCIVDVLGRAKQLSEAIAVIQRMPCGPDAVIWRILLGASLKWRNVEIGKGAFQALVDMDKMDTFPYVLMAQIYGRAGMWYEQKRILESVLRQQARSVEVSNSD